jgi:hypothetical protein
MRPRRLLSSSVACSIAAVLAGSACDGNRQGYYGPCDEPTGLAAGCPGEAGDVEQSAADACLKLASCGIIHVDEDSPEGADPDTYESEFERCIQIVQESLGDDPGGVLLACIDESTCADLSRTEVGDPPPDPDPRPVEDVVGWCGRFDP